MWKPWGPPPAPAPVAIPVALEPGLHFGGLERLQAAVAVLPAETRVVFVVPPVHASAAPAPGSAGAMQERICRQRLAAFAAARPGTAVLDYRAADPAWQDEAQFWDGGHVRRPAAERIEADIAEWLGAPGSPAADGGPGSSSPRSPSARPDAAVARDDVRGH